MRTVFSRVGFKNGSKMKKGDRVYCKKSCIYSGDIIHREGNYYRIGFIGNNSIVICEIISEYEHNTWSYDIVKDENKIYKEFIFSDYFYSSREYRKLKLERINESRG